MQIDIIRDRQESSKNKENVKNSTGFQKWSRNHPKINKFVKEKEESNDVSTNLVKTLCLCISRIFLSLGGRVPECIGQQPRNPRNPRNPNKSITSRGIHGIQHNPN